MVTELDGEGPCTSPQRSFPRLPLVKIDLLDQFKRLAAQPGLKSLRQRFNKEEKQKKVVWGLKKKKRIKVSFIVVIVSFPFILCWVIKGKPSHALTSTARHFCLNWLKRESWMVGKPQKHSSITPHNYCVLLITSSSSFSQANAIFEQSLSRSDWIH